MNYMSMWACILSLGLSSTTGSVADAASKGTFLGHFDDYGGNVSATKGQGLGYIRKKKSFDIKEEESHSKGYNIVLRWEWPNAKKPSHDDHNYMVICWDNFDDLSVSNQAEDEWQEIDVANLPEKFTSESFYYDVWFAVCKNEPDRF